MLLPYFSPDFIEAGCDEAGRGCLAGSVYAAAVILPKDYNNPLLNDSKQLTEKKRYALREEIIRDAVAWAVGVVTPDEIDEINILHASFLAMHRAIDQLKVRPETLLIDGNRFDPYRPVSDRPFEGRKERVFALPNDPETLPYQCIVKGDGKYQSIAAASILAKTFRDDYMNALDEQYPMYDWKQNKGYPTRKHREGIRLYGISPFHRKSYNLLGFEQPELNFDGE
ncbi:MAG: ribonuclease HII [Prevotella sp.]|nr:ribonuclease HII [Prevotella sp.]